MAGAMNDTVPAIEQKSVSAGNPAPHCSTSQVAPGKVIWHPIRCALKSEPSSNTLYTYTRVIVKHDLIHMLNQKLQDIYLLQL